MPVQPRKISKKEEVSKAAQVGLHKIKIKILNPHYFSSSRNNLYHRFERRSCHLLPMVFGMTRSQAVTFAALYVSYIGIYVCRKNYGNIVSSFTDQSMHDSEKLTLEQVGRLGTAFQLAAAFSKFVNPVLVDTQSPRYLLAGSLLICAATNILMSFCTQNLLLLTILWGINGFVNAIGWPALSKAFMAWFTDPKQRGTLYSIMSTNQSIGSALAPVVVMYGVTLLGTWKAVLIAPGVFGIFIAIVVFVFVSDKSDSNTTMKAKIEKTTETKKKSAAEQSDDMTRLLWKEVFTNPAVYMLGGCHMCVLLVRDGFSDLSVKYLQEVWKYSETSTTKCIWMIHIGGFIGSLVAGWISDKIYHGKRAPVIGLSFGCCAIPLFLLIQFNPSLQNQYSFISEYIPRASFFMFGLFSFTPHVLLGLMARELTSPKAQSTSAGTAKLVAHLGGAMAGSPLGYVVETNGWNGGLKVLAGVSMLGFSCMLPLWSRTAWKQEVTGERGEGERGEGERGEGESQGQGTEKRATGLRKRHVQNE